MKEKRNNKTNTNNNSILNVFLYCFLILCICLTMTLYFYYKFNSGISDELFLVRDVHKLKTYFKETHFIQNKNFLSNIQNSQKVSNQGKKNFLIFKS